ncbi:hypothetical protein J3F83DRAFT_765393 [Trichoderma novae-zelandiae]
MQLGSEPQPTNGNGVVNENENPPHIMPGISNNAQSNLQQLQLSRADPDIRAGKIHSNLPGCPKKVLLDINWHPPSRSGAFKLRTKAFFADDALEQAEQAIFLFIFPDKVQHLSLRSIPEPVQGGHTHVLHFDFKSPPTFVSPTKKLDSADPDSGKAIELFSKLVNPPTLDLPLDLATGSSLPATATALNTHTNLATLEDMCKAFADGNGMASILSCLSVSTLYNGKGGIPHTPAQFPDPNPPDYVSSRERPASHPTASRPSQRPRLDGQSDAVPSALQPHAEQQQSVGVDQFEELSQRVDTLVQQMESYRTTNARLQSMIEAQSDMQSRRHRSLTDEVDAQRAWFDVQLARSDTHRARSDAHFHVMLEQMESQRASFEARLQSVSQPRRLDALARQLDNQRDRSEARHESLTDQLQTLKDQLQTLGEDQTRRIDLLAEQVETLASNQARPVEDLTERVGYLEEDMRSTNELVRHNQRLLTSVEVKLSSLLHRIGRDDPQIGEALTRDLRERVHRREHAFRDEI